MDVSILFKIGAIGILTTVICQLFQHQGRGDLATLVGLAGLIIVLVIDFRSLLRLFSVYVDSPFKVPYAKTSVFLCE